MAFPIKTLLGLSVVGVLATGVYLSYFTVKTSEIAMVESWGEYKRMEFAGLHFKVPFRDKVYIIPTLTKPSTIQFTAQTQDQQDLQVVIDIQWSVAQQSKFKTQEELVSEGEGLFKTYRTRDTFEQAIIDTRTGSITKALVGSKTFASIITDRESVQRDIQEKIKQELAMFPVSVDGVQVRSLEASKEYREAIESKQIAEVSALADIERAKGINTIATAKANAKKLDASADAFRILEIKKADALGAQFISSVISQSGSAIIDYTKWKNWNGVMPTTYSVGSNSVDDGIGFGIGFKSVPDADSSVEPLVIPPLEEVKPTIAE